MHRERVREHAFSGEVDLPRFIQPTWKGESEFAHNSKGLNGKKQKVWAILNDK